MPYSIEKQGEKYCVIKTDTGEVITCHDTESEAQAHMAALYANEPDASRAAGEAYVYIDLANDPALLAIQQQLQTQLGMDAAEWQDPATFHVTLLFIKSIDDVVLDALADSVAIGEPIQVLLSGLDVFENGEERAVHIKVTLTSRLGKLQNALFDAMSDQEVSEYSRPENYTPHITLAYLKPNIDFVDTPSAHVPTEGEILTDQVVISRENYQEYARLSRSPELEGKLVRSKSHLFIRSINEQGEVEGYLAVWGSPEQRDSYKTWFDANNPPDLGLKGGEFLPVRLMYHHGGEGEIQKEIVGKVTEVWPDKIGIAFKGLLYRTGAFFERICDEIKRHLLGISTGSAEHLADFDDQGRFVNWYLTEVSLTPTPAEPRMPVVALIRSANGLQLSVAPARDEAIGDRPVTAPHESETTATRKPNDNTKGRTRAMLTLEQLGVAPTATLEKVFKALVDMFGDPDIALAMATKMLKGSTAPAEPAPEDGAPQEMMAADASRSKKPVKPAAPNADAPVTRADIEAAIKAAMAAPPAEEPKEVRPGGAKITAVRDRRFDHLSATEMAMGYQVAKSITEKKGGKVENILSEPYMRAMAYKTATRIEAGDKVANDFAIRSKFPFTRANEVMGTGQSGFGAEYAEDLPGTELWQSVRYDVPLYSTLLAKGMVEREIPQGYKSETIPLEGTDPTWYVASESTDVDANSGNVTPKFATSKSATGERQVTVAKLSVAIPFSKEEDEDSIIAMAPEQVRKIQTTAPERIEYILLNGDTDTTANTNINLIDGTPNTTTTKPSYTLLNGFLKLALVTNTANSRDGSTFDETDFTSTMALMAGNLRQNRERLLFVIDPDTGLAAANIPAVKTRDVFSPATLENGTITRIYRVDVLESGFMALANTAGKISATAANNVKGRLLLVRPDRWTMRWKRRLQIETVYNAYSDAFTLVAHMRFGLAYFDTDASACTFNLPV